MVPPFQSWFISVQFENYIGAIARAVATVVDIQQSKVHDRAIVFETLIRIWKFHQIPYGDKLKSSYIR